MFASHAKMLPSRGIAGSEATCVNVLSVEKLSKTYVTFRKEAGLMGGVKAFFKREQQLVPAVRDLSFSIEKGEFVGLLGPNGAGKTTTLKMLTGLIPPSSGRATAFGAFDTAQRSPHYLRRIGMVMGQRNQLNPDLPAADSFRLAQAIYGLDDARFRRRLDETLDLFAIRDKFLTPVRKLSLGERMKMELILAILHEPELLFLDEPTIGLDFNAARQIRGFLADANAALGITVVLTSHYTKDIEELCRRVVLVNHGRIVYDGALEGLDDRIKGQKVVTLAVGGAADHAKAKALIAAVGAKERPVAAEQAFTVTFDIGADRAATALAEVLTGLGPERVHDLRVGERELDDIFSEIYRKPSAEVPPA